MSRMTLEQAARWCGGTVAPQYAQVSFLGASNDSRSLEPGQLFVALEGARDGHEFIPGALAAGAAAVLCSRCDGDFPAIVVRDPRKALGDIARQERIRLNLKVVGVTGSVGKSTTKEMIAGILSRKYRTGKTPVNHNNDIGMPMAILALPEDTEVAVLEMGMNHFGEMAYLTSIAAPDIAVITNIGTWAPGRGSSTPNWRFSRACGPAGSWCTMAMSPCCGTCGALAAQRPCTLGWRTRPVRCGAPKCRSGRAAQS